MIAAIGKHFWEDGKKTGFNYTLKFMCFYYKQRSCVAAKVTSCIEYVQLDLKKQILANRSRSLHTTALLQGVRPCLVTAVNTCIHLNPKTLLHESLAT